MNRDEVQRTLTLIQAFDRRPFPPESVDAWLLLFAEIPFADAARAVQEHFDQPEPQQLAPGAIKRRATVLRETRERAAQRSIAPATRRDEPNDDYRRARREAQERLARRRAAAVEELARRLGNLERPPSRVAA